MLLGPSRCCGTIRGHFSALVTDLHMPGELNGMDLVAHVREVYSDLPVVISTGRPDVLTPRWIDAHRVTIVGKPYLPQALLGVVRQLVG